MKYKQFGIVAVMLLMTVTFINGCQRNLWRQQLNPSRIEVGVTRGEELIQRLGDPTYYGYQIGCKTLIWYKYAFDNMQLHSAPARNKKIYEKKDILLVFLNQEDVVIHYLINPENKEIHLK